MTDADLTRQEWLADRAAIYEFEAGMSREDAEAAAVEAWGRWERETEQGRQDAQA